MTNTNQTYWDYYRDVCDELQDLIDCDNSDGQGICDINEDIIARGLHNGTSAIDCAQKIANKQTNNKWFLVDNVACTLDEIKENETDADVLETIDTLEVGQEIKGYHMADIKRIK